MELRDNDDEVMEDEEMEVEQEDVEMTEEQSLPPPPADLSTFSSLLQDLETLSGLKLVKVVVKNGKEFCKLMTTLPPFSDRSKSIVQRIQQACKKCSESEEKRAKLARKEYFSCEGELFKTFLKNGLKFVKNGEGGFVLVNLLGDIFNIVGEDGGVESPILGIKMILSHSKAEDIFLEFHKLRGNRRPNENHDKATEKDEKWTPSLTKLELSNSKAALLKLWLILVQSFCKTSKEKGTEDDKKILENSVLYLMQMYSATLSESDRRIFSIIKLYTSKKLRISLESMPLFGPKCFDTSSTKSNPLYAHSVRANAVLGCISDGKAFHSTMKFKDKYLSEKMELREGEEFLYDLRFLIPLVCHVLDEKNICDVVKVISHGWIYIIVRGMGLNDTALRNASFLAYKRLVYNLHLAKGFRLQDVKIWLHFLEAIKIGFVGLEECHLPPLLATWMIATCEVLKQPSHPLYPKVTHFLLAKPTIDLSILPDFTNFFNAEDGNKESREWILNILLQGLQTKQDWAIAKKVPTIKYMCSLFPLEKITMQRTILHILANGAQIPEVAHDLVDRHGILLWVANMKLDNKTYYRRELEDIYRNLSLSCPYGEYRETMFLFVSKRHHWPYLRDPTQANVKSLDDSVES